MDRDVGQFDMKQRNKALFWENMRKTFKDKDLRIQAEKLIRENESLNAAHKHLQAESSNSSKGSNSTEICSSAESANSTPQGQDGTGTSSPPNKKNSKNLGQKNK